MCYKYKELLYRYNCCKRLPNKKNGEKSFEEKKVKNEKNERKIRKREINRYFISTIFNLNSCIT